VAKVNLQELTEIMGVSRQTLSGSWLREGMPFDQEADRKKGLQWIFDTSDVRIWREQLAQKKVEEKYKSKFAEADEMSWDEAKRREAVAKAQLAELQLAKERELLANIDDLMDAFANSLNNVRAKLLALPKLSGEMAHQDSETVRDLLEAEIKDTLECVSVYVR